MEDIMIAMLLSACLLSGPSADNYTAAWAEAVCGCAESNISDPMVELSSPGLCFEAVLDSYSADPDWCADRDAVTECADVVDHAIDSCDPAAAWLEDDCKPSALFEPCD